MAVAVFDADVLIAYLNREDAQHDAAQHRVRRSLEPGTRRLVSAVNYTEVLIGPLRAGGARAAEIIDSMLARLGIETIEVGTELARQAAEVRASTGLKLPDAFAVATAIDAARSGLDEVRVESFDEDVVKASIGFCEQ